MMKLPTGSVGFVSQLKYFNPVFSFSISEAGQVSPTICLISLDSAYVCKCSANFIQ